MRNGRIHSILLIFILVNAMLFLSLNTACGGGDADDPQATQDPVSDSPPSSTIGDPTKPIPDLDSGEEIDDIPETREEQNPPTVDQWSASETQEVLIQDLRNTGLLFLLDSSESIAEYCADQSVTKALYLTLDN